MHLSESEIIPYQGSPLPKARGVLVFAPHPDDEIFGCGGALARHQLAGDRIHVILLTSGDYDGSGMSDAAYVRTRLQESAEAARLLGVERPKAWGLQDRAIIYGEELIDRMRRAIDEAGADVVYAPSPWELHPDHRTVAMAAIESVRRRDEHVSLYLYEVSAPLRPNFLLDVTPVWPLKFQAMQAFRSQEEKLPYASFISALNRFRALTVFPVAEYVEAFELYTSAQLRVGVSLAIEGERDRLLKRGVTVLPKDAPLVSVIVRTMGRSTLQKAVASIALQTYTHIEVVLVDAAAQGLEANSMPHGNLPAKSISANRPLGRAEAANAGMQAAAGEYLIFLDDDDWLYPDHIAKLVLAMQRGVGVRATHTEVECVDTVGDPIGEVYGFPYTQGELRYGNFFPIHSVLFHRCLWESGCRFDANFDLYEDWDFWLQVEMHTPFGFVTGISAAYRIHPGAGEGLSAERSRAQAATKQIYSKWGVMASEETFAELVTRSLAARQIRRQLDNQRREMERLQLEAFTALGEGDKARQDAHLFRNAHEQACLARDAAHAELVTVGAALESQTAATHAASQSIEHLRAEIAAATSVAKNDVALARQHAANVEEALVVTRAALDSARADLGALLTSRSWRLSRPIRIFGRGLRNLRDALAAVRAGRRRGLSWTYFARKTEHTFRLEGFAGVRRRAKGMLQPHGSVNKSPSYHPTSTLAPDVADRSYVNWVVAFDSFDASRLGQLQIQQAALNVHPLVSIVMPVFNPQPNDLQRAIESVQSQIYENWELCICDDASTECSTKEILESFAGVDARVRLAFHSKNKHISEATNSAINLARGKYVAFLDQDDELRPHSLLRVVQMFDSHRNLRMLYSDEDKITQQGVRFDPYFKPDFNLGLLRSHNYMCHFAVYERELLEQLGGLRTGFEGAQDYDLALRAIDLIDSGAVGHIPSILYHWRTAVGSTSSGHGNKNYAFDAGRRALSEHLQRRGLSAEVQEAPQAAGMYRIAWRRPEPAPLVSIIIPTRNGHAILRLCLDSLKRTSYPHYEVIVVDNGSDESATLQLLEERQESGQIRVLRDDRAFNFSALNNVAIAREARGEFVLMLNNDIEVMDSTWLDEMVAPAMEPGVGCVGARLWYPDGRLQHGGVVLVCGVAGHAHKLLPKGRHGYMGRAVLGQDMVAVTAACLLVRKRIYDEVGGLDETLAVAFNDVDFCLRVFQAGYRNYWTPYAELIHHESLTRGYEDTPEKQKRFESEVTILQKRWKSLLDNDPCYNPNLTITAEDFSLAWPPRSFDPFENV